MPPPQYVVPPCDDVGMGSGAGSNLNNTLDDRMLDKDDLNALLYIVVTLLFYSMGIIIGIITYLKREKREIEEDKRFTDYMSMKMDPFSAFKVQNVRQVAERLKRLEEEKKARELEEAAANDIKSVEGDDAVFGDNEDNNEEDEFDDNDTPTTPLNASVPHRNSACARKDSHGNASTRVHLGSLIGGSEKSSGARLSSVDSDSVKMSSAKSSLSDNNSMRTDSDICFVAAELQDVAGAEATERRSNGVDSTCDSEDRQTVRTDTAERESIKTTDSSKDDIGDQCKDNDEGSSKDKSERWRDKGAVPKEDSALSRGSSDDKLKGKGEEKAEDRGWLGRNVRYRDMGTPPRSSGTPPRSSATPPRGAGTPPMPLAVIRVGDSERRGGLPISPKALHLFDFQSPPRSGRSAHGRQLVKQGTMPEARHGLPRRVLRKQFSVSDTRRTPVLQLQGSLGAQARPWLGSGDSEDLQSPDTFDVSRV